MQKNKSIIGLTGQSGAGKSTVAKIFQKNGFYVIDADVVSRQVTSSPSVILKLSNTFGKEIVNIDGTLNRRQLGSIVFSDKQKLNQLNNMLHPIILTEIDHLIDASKESFILIDAPQLFESGLNNKCNEIISVVAPCEVLVQRICNRDNITKDAAEKRIASQLPESFFRENSDYIIESDSTLRQLYIKTEEIIRKIKKEEDIFEL